MKKTLRVGILGAGLGSRLSSQGKPKPLALLGGESLLSRLLARLQENGAGEIHCALRAELVPPAARASLPQAKGLTYLFVDTESSLHTLVELISGMGSGKGPALFTMADTVLRKQDLTAFVDFCLGLAAGECAVLVTGFVDDEKPLWVHRNAQGDAVKFSSEPAQHVTSGIYFLSPQAMEIAKELPPLGVHKMRNFLAELCRRGVAVKTFVVSKTIDVDHPSDLEKAAEFVQND